MQIDYNLTLDDLIDFNLIHANNSPTVRKSLLLQRFLFPLIFLVVPFFFNKFEEGSLFFFLPVFVTIALVWVIYYPRYFDRHIKKTVKKMLEEGKNKGLVGKHSLTISPEGLTDTSEAGVTTSIWSSVEKVIRTENRILIYISSFGAFVIPLRAFENREKAEEFMQMVETFREER